VVLTPTLLGYLEVHEHQGVIDAGVPGMTYENCTRAIASEVSRVAGVEAVASDLERKLVSVRGVDLSDQKLRAAIAEAGCEVEDADV
jgi:copper chaperone